MEQVLTIILLAAVVVILFLVMALLRTHRQFSSWKESVTEAIRRDQGEIARREASDQLRQWREQELELTRQQERRTAQAASQVQFEQWKSDYELAIRKDAIQKSHAVTVGKVTEHLIPYLPEFPFNPKDARFIGSPIDFVVFDGLDDGQVRDIWLVEVKTGGSTLNTRERQVRDAVQAGNVKWREIRRQVAGDGAAPPAEVELAAV